MPLTEYQKAHVRQHVHDIGGVIKEDGSPLSDDDLGGGVGGGGGGYEDLSLFQPYTLSHTVHTDYQDKAFQIDTSGSLVNRRLTWDWEPHPFDDLTAAGVGFSYSAGTVVRVRVDLGTARTIRHARAIGQLRNGSQIFPPSTFAVLSSTNDSTFTAYGSVTGIPAIAGLTLWSYGVDGDVSARYWAFDFTLQGAWGMLLSRVKLYGTR